MARTAAKITASTRSAGTRTANDRFLLYSRPGCTLCDDMLQELAALPGLSVYPVEVADVDADADARMRYGHKIPVLLFAGELVCHGHLDADEVHKALAQRRRTV